jgi:hypothetical protein
MPLQTTEAVIKFVEDFGPLAGHSDKKNIAHGLEPFHIFLLAFSQTLNRPISDEYKIRIIEVTIGKNKIVPHLAPTNLFEALLLTAKFPSENTWVICEYFQKYGRGRRRRKGECPPDCIIQTDGRGNGTLYYPYSSQVQNRERRYHRLAAEALQIHGDMTMTQLSRNIGCDGGRNRYLLRDALRDLEKEGWVALDSRNRWKWCM